MARQLFPSERLLLGVSQQAGRPAVSMAGGWRTIYVDPSHSIPADITDADGNSIGDSRLQIDSLSRLPEFYGPDSADVLYDDSGNAYYPVFGPAGPVGPPGPAGDVTHLSESFSIAIASDVWDGDHSLGFKPAGVAIQDQTGKYRYGFYIDQLTATHYRIMFASPMIGQITLS